VSADDLTAEECAVLIGITPRAWRDRVRFRKAPQSSGFCPRTGHPVWDAARVLVYKAALSDPPPQPRSAVSVRDGRYVVRMLDWRPPPPARGRGFSAAGRQGRGEGENRV